MKRKWGFYRFIPLLALAILAVALPVWAGPGAKYALADSPAGAASDSADNAGNGEDAAGADSEEADGGGTGVQQVEVGFYPLNVYDLDMEANTFYADFYVWFIWEGDRDPTENVEFSNNVEQWGTMITPSYDEPEELPDGRYLQELRVEGRFYYAFNLEKYPFDKHSVAISLEDNELGSDEFLYVPSKERIAVESSDRLVGWKLNGYNISEKKHLYNSSFGDSRESPADSEYSRLQFNIEISRSLNYFIWKLLLPLIVVLMLTWSALLITADKTDARMTLAGMSLLTIMFLQQMYSDSLPELSYMTILDKIYALSYFLMIIVLLSILFTTRLAKKAGEADAVIRKVARYEQGLVIAQIFVFVAGFVYFTL